MVLMVWFMNRLLLDRTSNPFGKNSAFFLLGAGFMLIETKAITELGLAFGNTWHVIGIAISGVLVMAFLANSFVARFHLSRLLLPYALLLGGLALGRYTMSHHVFAPDFLGRLAITAILTNPIFFSGVVFSSLLKRGGDISAIMSANLLGAMFGGLLEYNSMYFGFGFLYIPAMALYALAGVVTLVLKPIQPA